MNLPRQLGRLLETAGHSWLHARDLGLATAADEQILERAREQGEIILTHDLDYGTLLAFSGDSAPSVVIFRRQNVQPEALAGALLQSWDECGPALEEGALVVVEEQALRIRRLPIRSKLQRA
jgi:predicted nuclease of predicted toxin-antitoxin system